MREQTNVNMTIREPAASPQATTAFRTPAPGEVRSAFSKPHTVNVLKRKPPKTKTCDPLRSAVVDGE
jgi:hypothetical protein